jgi:hypothetical protein
MTLTIIRIVFFQESHLSNRPVQQVGAGRAQPLALPFPFAYQASCTEPYYYKVQSLYTRTQLVQC